MSSTNEVEIEIRMAFFIVLVRWCSINSSIVWSGSDQFEDFEIVPVKLLDDHICR